MGLISNLLLLPLAPVRGVAWIAEQINDEAERQWYDPVTINAALDDLDARRQAGLIPDEDADRLEEELVRRLMEGGRDG
jgi:hypothetical protein